VKQSAVFLDRDGVLCENRSSYVKAWQEFQWIPGAQQALSIFARLEIPVVIVTNQSAINRGLTTFDAVDNLHQQMRSAIQDAGGRLDAVYVCPHGPDEGCACRKPGGLLFRSAAIELGLDLAGSYLIGDSLSDLRAGWSLSMRVILVRTGLGERSAAQLDGAAPRVRIVKDVLDAATWIEADLRRPRRLRVHAHGGAGA
jgi:D-glycero-D-manno-heptose 1,7-bisphosphate phosphatase